ncbi:Ferric/cupric reductase transmembrane component 2 [Staphylotrichum tortipilum]|uniref:Ferric/cupric reductase transmembrane component 2 n=1 Tax=Staphylotrichum tortipilum TaxID=2831512 RepID=A0AAN6RRK6_9PEZI|nr:Ferric/cupric reductase transmembrane component 2 [Staphylotrichum longicolle]
MAWPNYHFIDLSGDEKHARRQTLDKYALYAQLSALAPVAVLLLYRLARRAVSAGASGGSGGARGDYAAVPSSPVLKERRSSNAGAWAARSRRARWWLGEDVVAAGMVLGQRDQWIVGILWTAWLLLLCVLETGEDYLHLTKRIGLVAVSQWPLQYLHSLKSLNPTAYLLRSSHEQVNRWHRVLARITTFLLCLHATLYLNFFVQRDRLDRLVAPVVLVGVLAFCGLNLMVSTALRPVRRYSYRLFFIIHLVLGIVIPIMILLHAAPAKAFLLEALGVFFLDLVCRKMDTVTGKATLETIPGTNLIKISASIPQSKVNRFRAHPGSHIYLSIPAAARNAMSATSISHLLFEFLFNPFTVAAIDEETGDLTLVARHSGGPMTAALGRLAGTAKPNRNANSSDEDKIPLSIEGPYGAAARFPHLCTDFDRVLLIAGGVGATFTFPLYRSITSENPAAKVEMVWAIRSAGDATWAVTGKEAQALLKDNNLQLFVTGDMLSGTGSATGAGDDEGEVELSAMYRDRRRGRYTAQHNRKRPDLKKAVDELFKHGQEERVAVLVCGPKEMAREVREHVGVWVEKGRSVWYHREGFGF